MKSDDVTNENTKNHNPSLPQIPNYPYRPLIIAGLGSGITNSFFNRISHHSNIDNIYLYAKGINIKKNISF